MHIERPIRGRETEAGAAVLHLWRILGLCIAACLVNPNGPAGLLYPFSYLGNNASTRYIAEWVSPDFHQTQYQFFEALLLALIAGVALSARRPPVAHVLMALAFTHLALDSVRNINLFSIIVAPLIAAYVSYAWQQLRAPRRLKSPAAATAGKSALNIALAVVIAGAALLFSQTGLTYAHNASVQARRFPAGAVAFLRRHDVPGPMFNSYDWGGYLIWTLYPGRRVYVDGRPDMYGDTFIDQFVRTWQAQRGWQATLRRQGVRLVMVEPTSGLGRVLASERGWHMAYRDAISVIYERTS